LLKTKIFGHRGAAGTHPENTMISFKEAEREGADGIELDVQMSKDGVVVVIHDETLNRTTNKKGWVKNFTADELMCVDASYKFSKKFGFCPIPTLEDVFKWAETNNLIINVELKNGLIEYENLEKKVIELVRHYRFEKRVILSSFNHYSMVKCHQLAPDIETALLFMEGLYKPWNYAKQVGASAIHPYYPVAKESFVRQSQAAGIEVRPFTINKTDVIKQLMNYQCSAIITDFPEKAVMCKKK
jgi:glycerophosphoryl diester phosphodiesterase